MAMDNDKDINFQKSSSI